MTIEKEIEFEVKSLTEYFDWGDRSQQVEEIEKSLRTIAQQAKREERLKLKNFLGNKKKLGYGAEIKKWNENIDEILSTLD